MTDAELKDTLLMLVIAGTASTECVLTEFFVRVGPRGAVQTRLQDEQDTVLGDSVDSAACPTPEQLNSMEYLTKVQKEVLRLQPPAPVLFRKCAKTFEVGGYLVPKGYNVVVNMMGNQRSEDNYENAAEFDPDRWDDIRLDRSNMFRYSSWWYGMRQCIGIHFATAIRNLLASQISRRFSFTVSGDLDKRWYHGVTPLAAGDWRVHLRPRFPNVHGE